VGFICGTADSASQQARFQRTMIPRIALRALLFTSWRYPRTFKTLISLRTMGRGQDECGEHSAILSEYPAHLHIDLLAEYQGQGIGTRLMRHFEEHMLHEGVKGIHLQTSNHNRKAVRFYTKMGYTVVQQTRVPSHPSIDDLVLLTFAKRLGE
jgi:GNAT superfamily N-acetyltransferase